MKKTLLFMLLLLGGAASAQVINFTDINFKNKLLAASPNYSIAYGTSGGYINIDANNDDEIDQSEALMVKQLWLSNSNITSLEGLQYFTNLEQILCSHNQIASINLSLPGLKTLICYSNVITSLNVTGCTNLLNMSCWDNKLTSLDASNLPASIDGLLCDDNLLTSLDVTFMTPLKTLSCADNQITNLNITGLSNLKSLTYSGNPLPSLDISAFTGLTLLNCNNTGTTNLNLSGFTALEDLYCSGNPFTTLNTEDLTSLSYMQCNNTQLTELDLSHSPNLHYIHVTDNPLLESINLNNDGTILYVFECMFTNNPNLQFMCVDEGEDDALLQYFEYHELVPPFMSTDCNFTPGENFNAIAGTIRYDFDNNGCSDSDTAAGYVKVKLNDGTNEKVRITNAEGEYFVYVGAGNFNVSVVSEDGLFSFSPSPASVSFNALDGSAQALDFCLTANGVHPDAEIVLVPVIAARPGFDTQYKLILRNKGNQVLSGVVTFNFDDVLTDFVLAAPAETSLAAGTVSWNYSDLLPFERRYMYVTLNVNAPTEIPAVNIADILTSSVSVTSVGGDDNMDDNSFTFDHVVVGSLDPNNILCLQGDTEKPEAIGDYLHYVINFENIGDEAAEFVIVSQEIDEAMYTIDSFELLSTSHEVETTINGNAVEFRFNDINLGPDQMGNIVYKIKSLQTLEENDQVKNAATIVFDYNIPLPTNEAVTTFKTILGTGDFVMDNSVKVYPNPAKNMVKIDTDSAIRSIQLYDIQARLLQAVVMNEASVSFDMSERAGGIYFLKITTDKGVKIEKVVKE